VVNFSNAMLIELKDHGAFRQRAADIGIEERTCRNLMTLARHLSLLEKHKPDSQRAALAANLKE
jgi:hypothetical protein